MRLRRLLDRYWPSDPAAAKAMAQLGPQMFGPPCNECGLSDWRYMPPRHYAYANQVALRDLGKPLCRLSGVCQCRPGDGDSRA